MKKENVIYCAELICCLFFIYFIYRLVSHWEVVLFYEIILMVIFGTLFAVFDFWRDRIVEEKNPFNIKKVGNVLLVITEKKAGLKSEFVEDFGAEMYNLFLERGYIHELISSGDEDFEWQITKLGLRRKVEIFS